MVFLELRRHYPSLFRRREVAEFNELSVGFGPGSRPRTSPKLTARDRHPEWQAASRPSSPIANSFVQSVLKVVSNVEMLRVAARRVIAGMQDEKPVRNRTDKQLVGQSVRLYEPTSDTKMPVSALVCGRLPSPTRSWVRRNLALAEEPQNNRAVYSLCQGNHLSLAEPLRVAPRAAVFLGGC